MSNRQQLHQREDYNQVVKDVLRLLEEKNIPALIDLWADDGINYYPYSAGISPEKVIGKQAISEVSGKDLILQRRQKSRRGDHSPLAA